MNEGIKLFSINYSVSESNEGKVIIAYWVWVGLMTAIIILGVIVSKLRKGEQTNPNSLPPTADGVLVMPNDAVNVETESRS